METNMSEDNIRELSNKLDALMGLVCYPPKLQGWGIDWAIEILSKFNLSPECIKAVTGAEDDKIRKVRANIKYREARGKPSFLGKLKEQ